VAEHRRRRPASAAPESHYAVTFTDTSHRPTAIGDPSPHAWPRRPAWLCVPAAEPDPRLAPVDADIGASRCVVFFADHGGAVRPLATASMRPRQACDIASEVLSDSGIGPRAGLSAGFEVLELGRHPGSPRITGSMLLPLGPGTADSRTGPAMTRHQLDLALSAGRHAAERARLGGAELLIAGARGAGSGHTTRLLGSLLSAHAGKLAGDAADTTAPPIGARSASVPTCRDAGIDDPYELLRRLGGFEHAALAGTALAAAQIGLPALPADAAARIAFALAAWLNPDSARWHRGDPRQNPRRPSSGSRFDGRIPCRLC
jgi:NaMN:DMB phosphoribosyltransferase